jgi:hypothetical protein
MFKWDCHYPFNFERENRKRSAFQGKIQLSYSKISMSFNFYQVDAINISPLGKQQILDQVIEKEKQEELGKKFRKNGQFQKELSNNGKRQI